MISSLNTLADRSSLLLQTIAADEEGGAQMQVIYARMAIRSEADKEVEKEKEKEKEREREKEWKRGKRGGEKGRNFQDLLF
jgi:hypothetical protein